MQNFQFFDIILLALIAGFIAYRLYGVLGRRTGHERSPDEQVRMPDARPKPAQGPNAKDNVVPLPDRGSAAGATASTPLARTLMDIKLVDRGFDSARFTAGARAAYEMIVTAFAKGERDELERLLSPDVFAAFEGAIGEREKRGERVEFTFDALKGARITGAELKDRVAEVTITFESEVTRAVYDSAGALIEGDPKTPHEVVDIWTFARDVQSRDPNWTLVATASGG